jgi:hypothetical protein
MPSKRTEADGASIWGAACGGCGFAALTAFRMGITETALTGAGVAFGVTATTANGNEMVGAGRSGTDNDNDGEPEGRPEFRRGDDNVEGNPMYGPDGLTGDILVLTTCAMASFGTNESNSAAASPLDREGLMAPSVRAASCSVMSPLAPADAGPTARLRGGVVFRTIRI